jgi:hypothetical protein
MNRRSSCSDLLIDSSRSITANRFNMRHFETIALPRPRWMMAAAALAVLSVPGAADARVMRGGAYDGTWNVVFATTRGTCSSGYSIPFTVVGTRVTSAGGGRVSGSVGRGGGVAVQVSVGSSRANGGGRLGGTSGVGSWSGVIQGDRCSGTWQASRT